jgi:hypothetical protein
MRDADTPRGRDAEKFICDLSFGKDLFAPYVTRELIVAGALAAPTTYNPSAIAKMMAPPGSGTGVPEMEIWPAP